MVNHFKIENVRAGTRIKSASEVSDVPFEFKSVISLVVEAQAYMLKDDHSVIFVGNEIALLFKEMARDYDKQGTFFGYLDPDAQANTDYVGKIMGCPIYYHADLSPYTLNVTILRESHDGYLDSYYQATKYFAPKL